MTENLKPGQPSRFHVLRYSDEHNGSVWVLDQQYPELKSTATCKIDRTHFCAYCGQEARPIQAHLGRAKTFEERQEAWRYEATGYTCDCRQARIERKFQEELGEFDRKVSERRSALTKRYLKRLQFDKNKLLKIKHADERRRIEKDWFPDGILEFCNDPGEK